MCAYGKKKSKPKSKVTRYVLNVVAKFKSKKLTKSQADKAKEQLRKKLKGVTIKTKRVK